MKTHSYRDTWAEVRLDDIRNNLGLFKSILNEHCRMMAVIKADGYGHGAIEVARSAVEAGASDLGVAFLDEALEIIQAGITARIVILGHTSVEAVEAAIRNDVAITVFTEETMNAITACCDKYGLKARIHLKIDTGMTRLGIASVEDAYRLALQAMSSGNIELEGIFTHFADADGEDDAFTRIQFGKFMALVAELERRDIHIPVKHCCNSAATVNFPEMHLDMVRIGIGMYGLLPLRKREEAASSYRQAMSLRTCITNLLRVPGGTAVGYGCTYKTECDSLIATLPIGYADGYSRMMSNNGTVLVRGNLAPIVGNICMDQTMIDVTRIQEVCIGDEVILFGVSEGNLLPVDEIAQRMRSINYEVVCNVGKRVPRVYRTKLY